MLLDWRLCLAVAGLLGSARAQVENSTWGEVPDGVTADDIEPLEYTPPCPNRCKVTTYLTETCYVTVTASASTYTKPASTVTVTATSTATEDIRYIQHISEVFATKLTNSSYTYTATATATVTTASGTTVVSERTTERTYVSLRLRPQISLSN